MTVLINEMTSERIEIPDDHPLVQHYPVQMESKLVVSVEDVIRQGKYEGFAQVSEEVYRSAPYINNSFLNDMRRSPAHAISSRDNPRPKTEALEFGSLVHIAILERDLFEKRFVISPKFDRRTKEGKAAAMLFQAENVGKTPLEKEEYDQVKGMVDAVDRHPIASKLLSGGEKELSLFVFDMESGLPRKVKIDHVNRETHVLSNYKTTMDASYRAFQRDVWKYGYHRQSAGELEIYNLLAAANTNMAPHIVQEKARPYAVAVFLLDDATIEKGTHENRALLARVRECQEQNRWPAYPNEIQTAALPSFAWDEE